MTQAAQTAFKKTAFPASFIFFGFVAFFANWFSFQYFNLPVTEFIFLLMCIRMYVHDKNAKTIAFTPGFLAFFGLILWIIVADAVNQTPFASYGREITRNIVLIAPVLFLSACSFSTAIPAFCLGLLFGLSFFFGANVFSSLAAKNDISTELRWILPTPSVFLCLYFLLRKNIAAWAKALLLLSLLVSVTVSIIIDDRGALLSLALASGFAIIAKILPKPALIIPTLSALLLGLHFLLKTFSGDVYGEAVRFDPDSWSNLERAALIDYSKQQIDAHPFFGIGQNKFTEDFKAYFETLSHFRAIGSETALMRYEEFFYNRTGIVESPHNSFLEYSVFYGLPAGLLLLLFFWRIIYFIMRHTTQPALTAAALSIIVRHGALYGFNNIYRLEWFATMAVILWSINYNVAPQHVATQREAASQ